MTFPTGGPGYPQQGGAQPYQHTPGTGPFPPASPPSPPPIAANALNLPMLLALAVAVLGLVQYFLGFSDEASMVGQSTTFLLIGGLLAGLSVLPKAPKVLPFAALFSVLGALGAIDDMIAIPSQSSTPGIVVVVLILGFLQMVIAVGLLLLEYGVVKLPPAKPHTPHAYGQQFGQPGPQAQFGQQPQYGQQGQQSQPGKPDPSGPFSQPTKYSTPVNPGPGGQSTTYSPQQGQFFQQPSSDGEQRQSPGTPPGGFGKQS
jgi:hypothetical protein